MDEPLTRRQQKARETRDRIFYAACELFLEHGYHGTSVDKIAAKAEVAKGTFFVHFRTKDAVVTQLVQNQTQAALRARDKALAAGGDPLEALTATVLALGKQAGASKTLSRAALAAMLESAEIGGGATRLFERVFETMLEDARAAKRTGLLGKGVPPERFAWSLLASYLGSALYFTTSPHAAALVDSLTPLVEATVAASASEKGPARRKGKKRTRQAGA